MQVPIKQMARATPKSLVGAAEIQYEVDRSRSVRQVSRQRDVSTPLTPAPGHLLCLYLVAVRKRSASCSTTQLCAFLAPECAVQVDRADDLRTHMWDKCLEILPPYLGELRALSGAMTRRSSPQDHRGASMTSWSKGGKVPSQATKREVLV